jgi:hypothetical protein
MSVGFFYNNQVARQLWFKLLHEQCSCLFTLRIEFAEDPSRQIRSRPGSVFRSEIQRSTDFTTTPVGVIDGDEKKSSSRLEVQTGPQQDQEVGCDSVDSVALHLIDAESGSVADTTNPLHA